jgi:hypothetical protein
MKRRATFAPMKSCLKPMWFFLAFSDSGEACIVQGCDIVTAAREAHRRGINPGGTVAGKSVKKPNACCPEHEITNMLMSPAFIASSPLLTALYEDTVAGAHGMACSCCSAKVAF